jgi:hypothetical protein
MLARAISGDDAVNWTGEAQLLAAVFDGVNMVNYHLRWLGQDKNLGEPPEPLERPGVKSTKQKWTGNPVTIEEMDRKLGWRQN